VSTTDLIKQKICELNDKSLENIQSEEEKKKEMNEKE